MHEVFTRADPDCPTAKVTNVVDRRLESPVIFANDRGLCSSY